TLFMTLLSGVAALLERYTGQDDVVVGSPMAGRTRSELEGLIGFFINTLALRLDLSGDPAFGRLLERVRAACLTAYDHQHVPLEKLVAELQPSRNLARSPLFQVLVQLHNAPRGPIDLPGLVLSPVTGEEDTAKFDLVLNGVERGEELGLVLGYSAELFERATIERLADHLATLLAGAVAEPACPLSDLPLLSGPERGQLLVGALPADPCLHQIFAARAAASPGAVALVSDGDRLTYGELESRANQLARFLAARGIGPGVLVGLCLERSFDLVTAILGVLKAGGAYLPLDPDVPPARVAFMLEDSRVPLLLTQEGLRERLPAGAAGVVCLDGDEALIAQESPAPWSAPSSPDDPAYVIYTSGSTGRPKGVVVRHANVTRLFEATAPWFGFDGADVWTLFHSYAFDFSVWEIWGALLYGGRLVIVPYRVSRSPADFHALLAREKVTVLNQTPSAFRQLSWIDQEREPGTLALRLVIFGGEALELQSLAPWLDRYGDARPRLVNMYGITETTVHVTYREISRADLQAGRGSVIGRPIPDLTLHVLDRRGNLLPMGVPGELYVGGAGLAQGYLARPELTAERFVPDPFGSVPGARLYRSGDLARRLVDGDHEYLGRIDRQVKIRGFRIELGEIEAALASYPGVREVTVMAREGAASGERRLVAYVGAAAEPAPGALRAYLAARLPDYMQPSAVVTLPSLPLTANGKVDHGALPDPNAVLAGHREPETELERALAGLFRDILKAGRVGIDDDFFALGGSSITGAMLINRLQRELGEIVQVVVIFDHPTVGRLAAYLREQHPEGVTRWLPQETPAVPVAAESAAGRVDEGMVERLRQLVPSFPASSASFSLAARGAKNPPALFVLAPPRSGTTLLRVMLGGHPRLFAPPELELLGFPTMADRRAAFAGRDSFWLEGLLRALKEMRGGSPEEVRAWAEEHERRGTPTLDLYALLQEELAGRWLVDKTPSYALDPAVLRRAEEGFTAARYLHLVRHPCGMIRSFEEARLDQIFFRRAHPFTRRQLAELIWVVSHQNILSFLADVPADRQHTVRFEELLAAPERVLGGVCDFLGLEYHPDMARPYEGGSARMTDGLHAASRMLGDVKFHQHSGVDAEVAERWRDGLREADLGSPARRVAAALGYPPGPRGLDRGARIERGTWGPGEPLPLSFAQERLWFLDQLHPGTATYNIPVALRLLGRLDVAGLRAALTEVARRHSVLRTTFASADGRPVQVVQAAQPVPLPLVDLAGLPPDEREREALRVAGEASRRPFDLARGPVLRAGLLRLGEAEHVALVGMHHIASDGWSVGVLIRELGALWPALGRSGSPPLPEPAIQYADFALWQRAWLTPERLAANLGDWRERLADLPPLDLLPDRPRPPFASGRGATLSFPLPPHLGEALAVAGLRTGATLFMAALAGFMALLSRYAGQDDFAVGTPVAGRHHAELEELIGFFVNTLVLRAGLEGSPGFDELVGRVRQTVLWAFGHQDVPFERLVEELQPQRDLARPPLFQVMFSLQNASSERLALPGLSLHSLQQAVTTAKFELTLSLAETVAGLAGEIEYATDLFDRTTISRLAEHFAALLSAAVAAPSIRLTDLPLLGAAERQQLLLEWNDTQVTRRGAAVRIHELFEEQAARRPQAPAVSGQGTTLSYAELEARANRLARRLRRLGVGPETRVALCVDRSPEMVVALLGILKAGGAYVPLDPAHPAERLALVLDDSAPQALVTEERWLDRLAFDGPRILCLDRDRESIHAEEAAALGAPTGGGAESLAYVIYTSGSTGRPKGVCLPHGAVVNFLFAMVERLGLGADDVVPALTTLTFDIAGLEIYLPLALGGRVEVIGGEEGSDGHRLAARLAAAGVTAMQATPATWRLLLDAGWSGREGFKALCGGEALPRSLAAELLARGAGLWNLYGPTETAIWSATGSVAPAGEAVAVGLGRSIANTRLHVVDRRFEPVPPGVTGELLIAGAGMARGYWDRPDLTAERFLPDPWSKPGGARLYRTGDLVRHRADGELEFLGRVDHQIKLRGFRIELGEIEVALLRHSQVSQAAVVVVGEGTDRRLVAC
ncbi:MAG TPA: amino acid adenylation domain-containing protein, partial [Thermoanaerobaculia bacterium]|nr:amino acid adenylation domain-containing protein [Thermoanaerobaculia bacterium]